MAMRLSIAFDTTAESWMNQQVQYDLWQARQHRGKFHVTRLSNGERVAARRTASFGYVARCAEGL
jgi:plasmid maintenance system antidote protein VapI